MNDLSGGSIYVNGQFSGIGTIVCSGDLNMQAESQLNANTCNGISIYSGGSIYILDKQLPPQLSNPGNDANIDEYNLAHSALSKIKEFISTVYDANYSRYQIPKSRFTSEEYTYLKSHGYNFTTVPDNTGGTIEILGVNTYGFDSGTDKSYDITIEVKDTLQGTDIVYYPIYGGKTVPANLLQVKPIECGIDVENVTVGTGGSFVASAVTTCPNISYKCLSNTTISFKQILDTNTTDLVETAIDTTTGKKIKIKDSVFRGLLFACKDFVVNTPNNSFKLIGGLVAYGGNPDAGTTDTISGRIQINSNDSTLTYDSKYLSLLRSLGTSNIDSLYWTTY
jgi:hypothetical protein